MKQIVLLRGVNVGGRNKLPMKDFKMILERLGCANVKTYIQSGNAVFEGVASAADIQTGLKKHAGVSCRVFTVTLPAFRKITEQNPFARQAAASGKSVHLFLLDGSPSVDSLEALAALARPGEDFAANDKAVFHHTPAGLSKSDIAQKIDRVLGVNTTARNWNTVEAILNLAEAQ